jgi:ribosomal protein S18 acetylase RimI-like enzyme
MHIVKHVLDNPIWNALISGNKAFAEGADAVKVFPRDISPLVGLEENTTVYFDRLYEIIPLDTPIVVFAIGELEIPESWSILMQIEGFQMIYTNGPLPARPEGDFVALTDVHIPQMLSLTQLTNPGPFSTRTNVLGNFEGVIRNDQLVAMTGTRLHPYDYVEISAVCTHPDHTGKGYARQLMLRQMHHIIDAGWTPFLHVKAENSRAIDLYKRLGFEIRKEVSFVVVQKKG